MVPLLKDKTTIEKVQHFALRVCLKDWSLNYEESLDLTQLPFLEARRDSASLCFLYIIHQNMDFESARIAARSVARFTRHSNSHQLQLPSCHTTQYQNSFFPTTILKCNSMPERLLANNDTFFIQTSYQFKLSLTYNLHTMHHLLIMS